MRIIRIFALVLICLTLLGGSLYAQKTKGNIAGTVIDDEGVPLPGVTVEATSPKMIGKATAVTNEKGAFRLLAVPPGTYEITFSLPGFKPIIRRDIVVQVEQTITFAITMTPGTIEEEVTVIGMTPLVDVKSTAKGMTITRELFQLLPKGRNFDSLVTTVPGVYDDEDLLSGISVDGASGAENMFYIDGIDTTNLVNGESGQDVSIDFAEEIQFKASGYNAEYGGSVGGVIHVITRSGGNEFHGELLGYYSGTALEGTRRKALDFDFDDYTNAKYYSYDEYYGQTKDYTVEGGFMLSGYIIRDRLWFFGSFMPKYFKRVRTVDFAIQDIDEVKDYTRTQNYWNFSAKLTAQPLANLRMGASFVNNFYKYKGNNVSAYSGNPDTDYEQYGFSYPNYTASAYADLTLGNSGLLSVRGGYWFYNQTDQAAPVEDKPYYGFRMEQPFSYARVENSMFPEIPSSLQHPSGWQNYPRNSLMAIEKYIRNRITINADFSYYLTAGGEHAFKAGIQYMRRGEDQNNGAMQPIVYLAWDSEFVAYGQEYGRGKYGWYGVRGNDDTGAYGRVYTVNMNSWAIYAQDSWTIADKLTLNFGVRAESEYIPSYTTAPEYADIDKPVNFPFSKKIAPRLGFIYDVFGDQTFKIFGTYGIYHDVMKLYMGANALGGFKWRSAYYTLDDYDFTQIGVNNNYPGTLLTVLDFRPPVFDSIDKDMDPFTQREISFGAERQLMENVALSVRVVNKTVLSAIEDCGVVLPGIGEYYYYCNPGGDFINGKYQESKDAGIMEPGVPDMPDAKRVYWGVNVAIDKRFSNNWIGGLSYTWSSLKGNFTGLASGDELGRNSPNGERYFDIWHLSFDKSLNPIDGPLPTDRPHAFKAYGSYVFPFGLTIGAIVNAMSGLPISEEWNVDTPGYYPFNRNSLGRTPFLWFLNAYVEYNLNLGDRYKINFNVNVDNVFNIDTAQWIYRKHYRYNVSPGDEVLLTKDWNPAPDETVDPRFKKEYNFYDPISVRLGIKFMF